MSPYESDKRVNRRMKLEFVVGVRTRSGSSIAYTIDVSRGGVKLGSPQLPLPLGGQVELVLEKQGERYPFSGQVARQDGSYYINRIGRSVDACFIRIDDAEYANFAFNNYYV